MKANKIIYVIVVMLFLSIQVNAQSSNQPTLSKDYQLAFKVKNGIEDCPVFGASYLEELAHRLGGKFIKFDESEKVFYLQFSEGDPQEKIKAIEEDMQRVHYPMTHFVSLTLKEN